MKFLHSVIKQRIQLITGSTGETLQDVVFAVEHSKGVLLDVKVYLLPYDGLSDQNDKAVVVDKIVDGIIDGSFLKNMNVDITRTNLILLNSFDSLSSLESCYLFHLETGAVELKIFDLFGEIIIDKQIREKEVAFTQQNQSHLAKPYFLFFDTETTGLPRNFNAPVSNFDNWPRLVQLAYLCFDESGNEILRGDFIIKPEGFIIPPDSAKIHGITTVRASKEGLSLPIVLKEFAKIIEQADTLVGHNISFDEKIIGCEFLRLNIRNSLSTKKKICTMKASTNYCAINGQYGFKWPSLSELHFKLFRKEFEEAHNAMIDTLATAKCFWELKKIKEISSSTSK